MKLPPNSYKVFFESIPTPYLVLLPDEGFTIASANDAYLSATRTVREEILGKKLLDMFSSPPSGTEDPFFDNLRRSLLRVMESGSPDVMPAQKFKLSQCVSKGANPPEERYCNFINKPIFEAGNFTYIGHHMEDITECVHLTQKNLELEQYAFTVAHDLQHPMRTISTFIDIFSQEYGKKLDSYGEELLSSIKEGSQQMRNLIQELLNCSLVLQDLKFEPVNLETVLEEVRKTLAGPLRESDATIEASKLPILRANKALVIQVFQNLISNSVKYRSAKPPKIVITSEPLEDKFLFKFEDNGIGFEKCQVEKIFGLFSRLHTKEHYPGHGLGLALCKRAVERHQGTIWAESSPGKGATFYFTLPKS